MTGKINIESIPGGVRAYGTDPDVNMDDLVDAMFEGFLRSEEKLRESGRSHFDKPEGVSMNDETRSLTFGERAVGLTFNPSGDEIVHQLKTLYAEIINLCNEQREDSDNAEKHRLWSIAITEAQTAQMWGVKAATWRD